MRKLCHTADGQAARWIISVILLAAANVRSKPATVSQISTTRTLAHPELHNPLGLHTEENLSHPNESESLEDDVSAEARGTLTCACTKRHCPRHNQLGARSCQVPSGGYCRAAVHVRTGKIVLNCVHPKLESRRIAELCHHGTRHAHKDSKILCCNSGDRCNRDLVQTLLEKKKKKNHTPHPLTKMSPAPLSPSDRSAKEVTCHCQPPCNGSELRCTLKPGSFCIFLQLPQIVERRCAEDPHDVALCLLHGHGGKRILNPDNRRFHSYCCRENLCNADLNTARHHSAGYALSNATSLHDLHPQLKDDKHRRGDRFGFFG